MTKDLSVSERELLDQSLSFIKSLTIKNPYMVRKYETSESAKNAEYYMFTMETNREDIDFLFFTYTKEDMLRVGISNEDLLRIYADDNSLIPETYRDKLKNNKIDIIQSTYEEKNDYYRTLSGLPPYNTDPTDYIYVYVKDSDGDTIKKPIHELTNDEFYQIQGSGEYEKILQQYPNFQYLVYVHPMLKIPFYNARKTKDFYILSYNQYLINEYYGKQIIDIYYQILVYTMSVIYTKAYIDQQYYDSFMIIYMLCATLQKFFSTYIINLMNREVFDIESLRNIFKSYGLPFYDDIPVKYLKKIVKNINRLLSYKGTDNIFIDIAQLFGFNDTEIYRYYLIKDYIRDRYGEPISYDDDPDNFELKFAQVSVHEKDVSSYLKTDYLYQTYEDVVRDDPYWGQVESGDVDEELYQAIKENDFNYVSTKYLGLTTIFNMSKVAYETSYFFNLINQLISKDQLNELFFYDSDIKSNGEPIKLISAITGIYILLFRRFGYKDSTPPYPTAVASIYGFNFDSDLTELKDYMKRNSKINIEGKNLYYWTNDKIENLIKVLDMPNNPDKAKILDKYFSSDEYNKAIQELMLKTDDVRVYRALNALHNYNMYSQSVEKMYGQNFGKSGEYDTYEDWLKMNDPYLMNWINSSTLNNDGSLNMDDTLKTLDTMLESLDYYFSSSRFNSLFINTNVTLDLVKKYFIRMISIFKAYTVDLKKVNVYYMFDDKYINMIKIFSYMKEIVNSEKAESFEINLAEALFDKVNLFLKENDLLGLHEFTYTIIKMLKKDKIDIRDKMFLYSNFIKADSICIESLDEGEIHTILNENDKVFNDIIEFFTTSFNIEKKDEITIHEVTSKERIGKMADTLHTMNDMESYNIDTTFIDSNKIINGREDLSITYSYTNE